MSRGPMFRVWPVVLFAMIMGYATAARATAVLLMRPSDTPRDLAEALVRINGELLSVGFETELIDGPAMGQAARPWLEKLANKRGVDAVVAVLGDGTTSSIEVWLIEGQNRKPIIRQVPFEATMERATETMAIRALELLRSGLLEIELANREPRIPPPKDLPVLAGSMGVNEPPVGPPEHLSIEVGGVTVVGTDGIAPSVQPMVRGSWAPHPSFAVSLSIAGLGTRPTIESKWGNATVTQAFGALGGAYRSRPGQRVRPFLAFSAGVLRTAIEGHILPPNQSREASRWSLLFDGGFGAWVGLGSRLFLTIAAHAQVAEPYPAIRFGDTVVATAVRPSFIFPITVGAWL